MTMHIDLSGTIGFELFLFSELVYLVGKPDQQFIRKSKFWTQWLNDLFAVLKLTAHCGEDYQWIEFRSVLHKNIMLLSNLVLKLYRLLVLVLLGILFYCVYLSLTAVATLSCMEKIT